MQGFEKLQELLQPDSLVLSLAPHLRSFPEFMEKDRRSLPSTQGILKSLKL